MYKPGETFFAKSIRKGLNIEPDNKKDLSLVVRSITHLTNLGYLERSKKSEYRKCRWNYTLVKEIKDYEIPESDDSFLEDIFNMNGVKKNGI
jgi:hypothetical protein